MTEPAANDRPGDGGRAPRLEWVDTAKCLGILLMFYGHVMQSLVVAGNEGAWLSLRFIYSFHMPLFFVLAGFFFRPVTPWWSGIGPLARRRLFPVAFFGLLLLPLWSVGPLRHGQAWWPAMQPFLAGYLLGRPLLDWVTWFLVCLFICEVLALICLPIMQRSSSKLIFAFGCLWAGAAGCEYAAARGGAFDMAVHSAFAGEAVIALGFYTLGHASFAQCHRLRGSRPAVAALFVAASLCLMTTFQLNQPNARFVVMMAAQLHGNTLYFVFTALAGSAAMVALSMLLPGSRLAEYIGRNTLPLLGLNGIFFHFVNPKLASWVPLGAGQGVVIGYGAAVMLLSILGCIPAIYLLNRFVPQLVGHARSTIRGRANPAVP